MNHNQLLWTGFLFSAFQVITILPICTVTYMAAGLAMRQKQAALLSWLLPLASVHTLAALLILYQFGFRLLHLRANGASAAIAYGLGMINAVAALYFAWRILAFVKDYSVTRVSQPHEEVVRHEEGVWPPPPTQKPL